MSHVQLQRSMEDIRLEIMFLAAEVLFLVSVLGAIILFNLDLYSQSRKLTLSAESISQNNASQTDSERLVSGFAFRESCV
ncbi:hypothetical protein M440DRAFT_1422898 [Trichoderma longibrachiatum ATCC 18648]|uniref:Uncharacterized protein n=1 Tax=Trichoderma longibrachiatum ATCC 18648 TaxID=983965 RepID=A0A2T4C2K4_TRILO|nr:hypothetical protein M440DRAFT_1422898 [Trichoderma longibrachiatum ATCC 18648]